METQTQQLNVQSFRRDVKHLAQVMDLVNAMAIFDGEAVLDDARRMLSQIEETLKCYAHDACYLREQLESKLARWRD